MHCKYIYSQTNTHTHTHKYTHTHSHRYTHTHTHTRSLNYIPKYANLRTLTHLKDIIIINKTDDKLIKLNDKLHYICMKKNYVRKLF